jgi:hypothetical protein
LIDLKHFDIIKSARRGQTFFALALFILSMGFLQGCSSQSASIQSVPLPGRVNQDRAGTGQREPVIAADGLGNVYVAYIDVGTNRIRMARSTDNGVSFTDNLPLGIDTGGVDPTLAIDSQNRLYFGFLSGNIQIVRSDNQLNSPLSVPVKVGTSHSDRPWLAIGNHDEVYVTWAGDTFPPTACSVEGYKSDIFFARSIDGGLTFSAPQQLTPPTNNQRCSSAPIGVGPGGEVYVLFNCLTLNLAQNPDCDPEKFEPLNHHMFLARSDDDGQSFTFTKEFAPATAAFSDASYMAFPMAKRRSNWGAPAVLPDGTLGIAWPAESGSDVDILFATSSTKGETFNPPIKINDDAAPAYHFFPWLASDAKGFYAVWMDSRSSGLDMNDPAWAVYVAQSLDGGKSFQKNIQVSAETFHANDINNSPQGVGDFFGIFAKNGKVYATWSDTVSGDADIYAKLFE